MKRLLSLLTLCSFIFVACSNDDNEVNTTQVPGKPVGNKITLSISVIEVGFESGEYSVFVTSPYSWDAVSKNDWINLTVSSGIAGTKELKFAVESNEKLEARDGTIVIQNKDFNLICELYVSQAASVPSIQFIEKDEIEFGSGGGTKYVEVISTVPFEAKSLADWLYCSTTATHVEICADATDTTEDRSAEVIVYIPNTQVSKTINVSQRGKSVQLETPVAKAENITENGFTLVWEAVANAAGYEIRMNNQTYSTEETSYVFEDLNKGTYKAYVMAKGSGNYTDSEYSKGVTVTVEGASSVAWFSQTVALPEDNAENAAKGINSSNTMVFNWTGDNITSLNYMYFLKAELPETDAAIIDEMEALDAETLAEVNQKGGVDLQFTGLAGGQDYVVCAFVTKGENTYLAKSEIKTNDTILTTCAEYWIGVWNAHVDTLIDFGGSTPVISDQPTDFTYNVIQASEYYSDYLAIDGQSTMNAVFGDGNYLVAYTDYTEDGGYVMYVVNPQLYDDTDYGGYYMWWLAFGNVEGAGVYFISGQYPAIAFVSDGTNVTCQMYKGNLQGGGTFTIAGMDILFGDSKGSVAGPISYTIDEEGNTYDHYVFYYGPIQLSNKTAATRSSLTKTAKKHAVAGVVPTSCVIAM